MGVLKGVRIFHQTKSKGRIINIKHKAWTNHGAEIVQSTDNATHIVVGANIDPTVSDSDVHRPIVTEAWPSECIEQNRLLDPALFRYGSTTKRSLTDPVVHDDPSVKKIRATRQEAFSFDSSVLESSPNQQIIDFFHELANQRSASGKEFSKRAYERAIKAVEDLPMKITSVNQACLLLPTVFRGRIKQGLETVLDNKLPPKVLEQMQEKSNVLLKFKNSIYGVGAKRALEFYNKGCRTLEDVRLATSDPRMLVSIEHSEELLQRISRTEVYKHYEYVTKVVHELDPDAETLCMGSYRRLKEDCGDIDIIITKKQATDKYVLELMHTTIDKLFECNFAVYTFGGRDGSHRWLGATALSDVSIWRRMDILAVKYSELGAAMCYYTGSDMFNRYMRFHAQKIGLQLNENGLFVRDSDLLVEAASERAIFEKLGIKWTEPQDRTPDKFELLEST